ncbi:MAG TPA: hypothetical protein PKE63_06435 [Lacibacter sp.]|nr:hypothetical protein [Lacibacter sp.]HMO87569.1 hypothetical protein [Lacibacter sp.]HMP86897.1 hypothetical protein [Lacibacter sp.]
MKFIFRSGRHCLLAVLFSPIAVLAQEVKHPTATIKRFYYLSVAAANHHSAFPFSRFSGLATGPFHPGFEVGTGFDWKVRSKHDWYQDFRLGYFYHRFLQHGIPLYTSIGYRYKFSPAWNAHASLGAGYLHSIPAVERFRLNGEGEYEKVNNLGRMQGMAAFNLGTGYKFAAGKANGLELFVDYQQRLQFPFVKKYAPLFPYNSLQIGVKKHYDFTCKKKAGKTG